jgi:chromosomal replication initiator protein
MTGQTYITAPGLVRRQRKVVAMAELIAVTGTYLNLTTAAITSQSRKRELVIARQWISYVAREKFNFTFLAIGVALGGRDHTTTIHSIQVVKDLLFSDPVYKQQFSDYLKHVAANL